MKRNAKTQAVVGGLLCAALTGLMAGPASAATVQADPVHRLTDGSAIPNTHTTLSREQTGVTYSFDTRELTAGHAYTLWLAVFNQPSRCTHGQGGERCGAGDLPAFGGDDSAQTSFLYGDGLVAHSAPAMLRGQRATGTTDGALWGPGIVNPLGAEIHLLLRDHGVATPETAYAMTHSFDACQGGCVFVQFSAHPAA
jgi:hypothetical protein